MNERKVKSPNSASGHQPGHSQQRSITPHQRGQTPPQFRAPEEVQQAHFYQHQSVLNKQFNIPPPQSQGSVYAHELSQQSQPNQRFPAPGAGLIQQSNMYQQQQQSLRPQNPQPFYRPMAQANMNPGTQFSQMQQQPAAAQPQYPTQPGPGMYIMPPSQTTSLSYGGAQIIMQPQPMLQQNTRMNSTQYPSISNATQLPFSSIAQPTSTYYNNPQIVYGPQPTRPPSNPSMQSSQPKREKKILQIVDPKTGKDISSEILHTKDSESSRSTPPSGSGSDSRGTPDMTTPPPNNDSIAAQFAAQVAATLRPASRSLDAQEPDHSVVDTHSQMDTSVPEFVPVTHNVPETVQIPEYTDTQVSTDQTVSDSIAEPDSTTSLSSDQVESEKNEDVDTLESKDSKEESTSEVSVPIIGSEPPSIQTSTEDSLELTSKSVEEEPKHIVSDVPSDDKENISQSLPVVNSEESVLVTKTVEIVSSEEPIQSKIEVIENKEEIKLDLSSEPAVEAPKETVDVKKPKKKPKDFNKKNISGTDMDAFVDTQPEEKQPALHAEEEKQPTENTAADVPKVEIKIEDISVQEQNEKNQQKSQKAALTNEEDNTSSQELRYKYKEDQWSPLNPEGKRLYDRDFLLSIQYSTESTTKPAGLPDLPEIILDKPHTGSQSGGGGGRTSNFANFSDMGRGSFDFTPGFVRGSPRPGGGGGPQLTKRGSAQGRRGPNNPPKVISIGSMSQDVVLHKAEAAWKPGRKQDEQDKAKDEETLKTEELYKKVRSVLNKLTPQKFQTLVKQVSEMEIDTEERLKGVTDLVFEKAISEPGFSVAYASMCRYLAMIKVPSTTKQGEFVNFRAILLTRCQKEFEKDKDSEKEMEERRRIINETEDKAKSEELKEELEVVETKARRRSLGNIRFIGELFNLKMLTENIMHDCLFKLLRAKDEESLECLCRLLSTIGKELDSDKAKPRMDQYFNQMEKIVIEKKTSSRTRFMLQDCIDLRKSKWVPRRDENNPKTLDQIHKEALKEEQQRQMFLQQASAQQKAQGRGGGGGARGSRGPPNAGGPSDGWNTVGKPNIRVERQTIDPSRLKLTKQNLDESNIQLGPGGGANRFSGWQRGSTGGGARNSQEAEKSNAPSNRFSALSKPEDENRSRFGVSPARGDNRGRGFGRPSSRVTPRSSMEQEKERALAAVRDVVGGQTTPRQGQSRESSRGREPRRVEVEKVEKPVSAAAKELTEEEVEKKTIAILDEYLHVQDIKEAILCVEELNSPSTMHLVVSTAVNHVLERSAIARSQTGHLLHDLVKKGVIPVPVYIQGLTEVLQYAEDMEIDIPKIWQYFGELIGPMVQDGSVPLNFLRKATEPLKESNKAGNLVAEVLHAASHREGHKKVGLLWRQSSLKWDEFVPSKDVKQFISDKKLEFTEGDGSQPSTPTVSISMESIQEKLNELLLQKRVDNETMFDWIEDNVDDKTIKSKKFVRVLMSAVCQSAITGSGNSARVVPDSVKNRGVLLQKYLDHKAEFELQALYALQALVHKLEHPPGVLRTLFDTLYDEDIISEDAFNQWEKSTDPNEQEGKGVAMKQVVQFFTWLREADEDMSDS